MPHELLRIEAQAPASVANVGPGFDCLAFAVDLRNRYVLYADTREHQTGMSDVNVKEPLTGDYYGPEEAVLSDATQNLFVTAFKKVRRRLAQLAEVETPTSACFLDEVVNIPPWRGLGSSSSAAIAGTLAAIKYFEHFSRMSARSLLKDLRKEIQDDHQFKEVIATLALMAEDCRDNLPASLDGGLTYAFAVDRASELPKKQLYFFRDAVEELDLRCVVLIPKNRMPTREARKVLKDGPSKLSEVVFNLSRATCLPGIFRMRRFELLEAATEDTLHTPIRAETMFSADKQQLDPKRIFSQAVEAGAYCGMIAGSGSSLAALAPADKTDAVAAAMRDAFDDALVPGWEIAEVKTLCLTDEGASVSSDLVPAESLREEWVTKLRPDAPALIVRPAVPPGHSAFWCYNRRRPDPEAGELADRVIQEGSRLWRDVEDVGAGQWKDQILRAMPKSRAFVVVVGADGINDVPGEFCQRAEIEAIIKHARDAHKNVIPVTLPGGPPLDMLPYGLSRYQGVDMRGGITPEKVQELVRRTRERPSQSG